MFFDTVGLLADALLDAEAPNHTRTTSLPKLQSAVVEPSLRHLFMLHYV